MSSNRTLTLMFGLVAVAGIGRFWVHRDYADTVAARDQALRQYQQLWETVDDLQVRLKRTTAAKTEGETLVHFQQQALRVSLGSVNTTTRETTKAGWVDRIFTVEFETDNPRFRREDLVNFLYNSENLMPRMRSTRLSVRPAAGDRRRRQLPPGSEREDLWRVDEVQFTQRSLARPSQARRR